MSEKNENKSSYYKQTEDGYSVFFDGLEVANELTQEQASGLLDDLSYYGMPMKCVYNRDEICIQRHALCIACPERKKTEVKNHV